MSFDRMLPVQDKPTHPDQAIEWLVSQLSPVELEPWDGVGKEGVAKLSSDRLKKLRGRYLAEPLVADRDSPPVDVSAMDGYALPSAIVELLQSATRSGIAELVPWIPVSGTSFAGTAPLELDAESALRIFTGASVPASAHCVIPREETLEQGDGIVLTGDTQRIRLGLNIRRRGENGKAGDVVLPKGTLINASAMSAVSTFATFHPQVFRKVRVAIATTGDELIQPGGEVQPWQIRDSNGPVLASLLTEPAWIEIVEQTHLSDKLESITAWLQETLPKVDAIFLTGGVSMGDGDFVPDAIRKAGGRIGFHKLPIRPGKPILGAFGPSGQVIFGLPGNPVSVLVTARRIAVPVLRFLAGAAEWQDEPVQVSLANPDSKKLGLVWYRLVQSTADGRLSLLQSQGSGDLVSLARSVGFIEVPIDQSTTTGPWPLYRW